MCWEDEALFKLVPNILTIMNLILGMAAVLLCLEGLYAFGAILVVVGMFFDGLDGRVARLLGAQSDFGRELDSLCDLVTFGVAPAAIMYLAELRNLGVLGGVITIVFPVAGAIRLAKFNVRAGRTNYFVGLPITAAGGILATLSLYRGVIPLYWLPILTLALSYLMVSRTRYPNFKKLGLPRTTYWVLPVLLVIVGYLFLQYRDIVPQFVFLVLAIYGVYGVWYDSRAYMRRRHAKERLRRML